MKTLIIIIAILIISIQGFAQNKIPVLATIDENNDTLYHMTLPILYIVGPKKFTSEKEKRKYGRTVRYVKKVLPYAKLAGKKLRQYEEVLKNAKTDAERKKIMKKAENELRAEYEGKITKLTIIQGHLLVKLIDRETKNSSYELITQLRGSLNAMIWQGVGRVFGYDLKDRYDPTGADKEIEEIVLLVEAGAL